MLIVRRRIPATTQVQVEVERPVVKAAVKPRSLIAGSASDMHTRTEKAKLQIEAQLKLISNAYTAIDQAQEQVDQAFKIVEAQLRLVNLTEHTDGVYRAALEEVWTRQSRTVDPKKFRAHVAADVFWDSIKVSLEKVKEHISEKELNNISDIVASKMTGRALKVSKVSKTKGR